MKPDWWHPAWVPFGTNGCGDSLCVDMAPGKRGKAGQVIEMIHDNSARPIHARSFKAWLSQFADELENGEYHTGEE